MGTGNSLTGQIFVESLLVSGTTHNALKSLLYHGA